MSFITNKPAWFDLSNYPDFNSSPIKREWDDEAEWAYNFHIRLEILNYLNSAPANITIQEQILQCRKKGFLNNPFKAMTSGNIQSLSIKDIGDMYQSIRGKEKIQLDKYNKKGKKKFDNELQVMYANSLKSNYPSTKSEQEFMTIMESIDKSYDDTTVSDNTSFAHVSINLNAPLNTLVNEFTSFVKAQKEKKSITYKAKITPEKIKKWARYQVLAYLDLLIYSEEIKSDITQKHYGEWLFPNEYNTDTTEMFRKSTKTKADEILNPEFIKYITSQCKIMLYS